MDFNYLVKFVLLLATTFTAAALAVTVAFAFRLLIERHRNEKAWNEALATGIWWKYDKENGYTSAVDPFYKLDQLSNYPEPPPYDENHPEPQWEKDLRKFVNKV